MKNLREKMKSQGGFTLVEMLIVVAIIAILVAVSIPLVNTSLDEARKQTDKANERAAKMVATVMYMNAQMEGKSDTDIQALFTGKNVYDNEAGTFSNKAYGTNGGYGQYDTNKGKHIEASINVTGGKVNSDDPIKIEWK